MDRKITTIFGHSVIYWAIFIPMFLKTATAQSVEELYTMRWNPGDRISCTLAGIGGYFGFQHWMLAIDNSSRVIHINLEGDIMLHEKHEIDPTAIRSTQCINHGPGAYDAGMAISRAKLWDRTMRHYYNLLWCNCRHWVKHWTDGYETMMCPLY